MFAIAIHIVKLRRPENAGDGSGMVQYVIDTESVPNSDGNPTVEEYLALEAADDFLINAMSEYRIVTVSASDLNNA